MKSTLTFTLILTAFWGMTQTMGPQRLAQLEESPAGSKLLTLLETINASGAVTEASLQNIFSSRLVEKFGLQGLGNFIKDIREKDGTLVLYQADRRNQYEYALKLKSGKTEEWLDMDVKLEEQPPYGIDGFGVEFTDQAAENTTPLMAANDRAGISKDQARLAELVAKAALSRSPRGNVVIEGELGRKLDDFLQKQFEQGFSGAALVVQRGKTILYKGYGFADRENDLLNRPETVFSIGSITKDFTTAAILKLEEAGKLSVSDHIDKYLDGVPEDKKAITIDHLLTHKGGLHEYHDRGEFEFLTYEQAMDRIMGQELLFEPGKEQAYSNPGYALLAAIIEKTSGKSYKDYIRQAIIAPAGMPNAAFFSQKDRMQEDRIALGYDGRQFGERNSPYYWVASWQNMGAGGLVMTLRELYDWRLALEKGKILGEQARKKFLEIYNPVSPAPWGGTVRAFAGGNDHGFNMIYLELPQEEAFIILASNTMYRRAERFARSLTRLFLGQEVEVSAPVNTQPFTPRDAHGWGLPETPAGKTAARWLNALCAEADTDRKSFVQGYYGKTLSEEHTPEDHENFLRMIYTYLQIAPEIQDLETKGDTALTFRMYSAQTGERIKVEMEVEKETPHRIMKILVGD